MHLIRQIDGTSLIASDIHIHDEQSASWTDLRALIERHQPQNLIFLGDIFHAWIGWDTAASLHEQWRAWLTSLRTRGTQIYWMPGNHDALLRQPADLEAMCLLDDPCLILFGSARWLLTHGDLFCSLDSTHQYWRTLQQHLGSYFLKMPRAWRQRFRAYALARSKRHTAYLQPMQNAIPEQHWIDLSRQYNLDMIVHGHTHQPNYRDTAEYRSITLGDWHHGPQWLWLDAHASLHYMDATSTTITPHKHIPLVWPRSPMR